MNRQQRLVLTIAVLASFVAFLDGSVINVALPAISDELGGGLTVQQWVVDAYLITLGSLILLAGSLSDVVGRILILRIGLIGFGVTSVLCAVSPTPELLIVSRGLQGVAGALLVPSSLALILSSFRGAAQAKAIGQWTAWTSSAFLAGPLLGGLFVDYLSWRWVFAINVVPIAVTVWLLIVLGQRDTRVAGSRIDFLGAALCVLGLGGPVFALIEQANYGWGSPAVYLPFTLGLACFAGFLWRQRVAAQPLMPLSLFTVRNFWVGNLATVLVYGALSLGGFVLVLFLQQVAGFPATLAALALLPMTILNIALSSSFGTFAGKFGPRRFMAAGPIIAGLGYLLMLGAGEDLNYWTQILPGVLLFGLGLSITVAPLTSAILGSISPAQSGIGSAINNAVSRVAGLIAIALAGVIVGESFDVDGFHRGLIVTAVLLILGGIVSALGIRDSRPATPPHDPRPVPAEPRSAEPQP
ncbi:EmrB/QacA subfamily drug resistance transporter [Glaciihabitans tibetensis]|uniref:EmrB/QacA subfamily drug resistance transporter n=1 Tax=Glaciihabitans tibetensis TaxID=1266600 RepID=A0A2T0VIY0_9MICO|nr:MFS transporter [Glaciihabitans tibetensis]PRY70172.1 EmrB/QacA subfamily drug resistance transporter [Glaciihabitans tibetensis]